PLFFLDYFATGALDEGTAAAVVAGIAEGCRQAGCALVGGETAEMPGMYGKGDYDLAGFSVGAVERGAQLTGKTIAPGDVILGLASSGVHSNGYSLVRRIVADFEHDLAAPAPFAAEHILAEALLTPTRIYVAALLPEIRAGRVKALAHITGGGLLENIPRVLGTDHRAVLDAGTWSLPPVIDWLRAEGHIAPDELARTFNCGIGMAVICAAEDADALSTALTDAGETVAAIGRIETGTRGVTLSGPAGAFGAADAWTATHDQ
ncbi:MAG: phosphoribosylformylglycinamidine cyclo-ligase, partial [Pseudomonadota bacterium]